MKVLNKHVIDIVISFLAVVIIYSTSSTLDIFGEIKSSGIDCIPEKSTNYVTCCYKEYDTDTGDTTAIYCAQCYDDGKGNLACNAYDKVESIKPSDDSDTSSKNKGLLGLLELDKPTILPDNSIPPSKGNNRHLDLLEEASPAIKQQQLLPETTIPQKDFHNDLLSNFDDNLFTNNPKKDSEPSNLLESEQQESPETETDETSNENIIKEGSKDNEQDSNNQIYCIKASWPDSNSNDNQDQRSKNHEEKASLKRMKKKILMKESKSKNKNNRTTYIRKI